MPELHLPDIEWVPSLNSRLSFHKEQAGLKPRYS